MSGHLWGYELMPLPPKGAQSILVWPFKSKQTKQHSWDLTTSSFLTLSDLRLYLCLLKSRRKVLISLFRYDSKASQGPVIPTEWQTQHLWDRETGTCSDILIVRNSKCTVSFSKDHIFHPKGIEENWFPPQMSRLSLKNPWTSPWAQGKLCPQHPFLRSLSSRNISPFLFLESGGKPEFYIIVLFSFETSQVIAFQCLVWSTLESLGECMGGLSLGQSSWNLISLGSASERSWRPDHSMLCPVMRA